MCLLEVMCSSAFDSCDVSIIVKVFIIKNSKKNIRPREDGEDLQKEIQIERIGQQ